VCYMTVYWGYTITITLLQRAFPKFFYEFKIQSSELLPTFAEMASMVPLVLFNQIFLAPPILCSIVKLLQIRSDQGRRIGDDGYSDDNPSICWTICTLYGYPCPSLGGKFASQLPYARMHLKLITLTLDHV
jgi:hypothetical protein